MTSFGQSKPVKEMHTLLSSNIQDGRTHPLISIFYIEIQVQCSVRVRQFEKGIPGHHNYSENFPAGMFVSIDSVNIKNIL